MLSTPAQALLDAYDQLRPVSRNECGPIDSLAAARTIQDEIIAAREARGEDRIGYKIGFTNRTIWERYGVHHPIWGPVYNTTTQLLDSAEARISTSQFVEPRLEPEIVVKMAQVPERATPATIARSLAWVAFGYEIVQSHFPGWQFSGAESFAAQGLHGALLVGPQRPPQDLCKELSQLPDWLANISVALMLNNQPDPVDRGVGSNVLDGPIHAIAHLMTELAKNGRQLAAGDIITTGTITDALPLRAGQHWQSTLDRAGSLVPLQLLVEG